MILIKKMYVEAKKNDCACNFNKKGPRMGDISKNLFWLFSAL